MGAIKVTTTLSNLARSSPPYENEFLVDTGAIDCMAPESALAKAGIQVEGSQVCELANGQPLEYNYGFARVSLLDDQNKEAD